MADFIAHFSIIPDPRIERRKRHKLIDILFLCMAAVACGAEGWEEIEDFGEERKDWLRQYLPFANGIPGHDSLHWSLDMAFREDECRIRRDNGAEFFAIMRRLSMNVIKKDTSKKAGIHIESAIEIFLQMPITLCND